MFGVTNSIFRVDWLHCVDEGVCADMLCNLFKMIIQKLPGTKQEQGDVLWKKVQQHYLLHFAGTSAELALGLRLPLVYNYIRIRNYVCDMI